MIRTKRVYDPASAEDGRRVLIDRLWPRGLTKQAARLDEWRRDLSPSSELRIWFGHDPAKFARFRQRYRQELLAHRDALEALARRSEQQPLTLLYAGRDPHHTHAIVLKERLEELLEKTPSVRKAR